LSGGAALLSAGRDAAIALVAVSVIARSRAAGRRATAFLAVIMLYAALVLVSSVKSVSWAQALLGMRGSILGLVVFIVFTSGPERARGRAWLATIWLTVAASIVALSTRLLGDTWLRTTGVDSSHQDLGVLHSYFTGDRETLRAFSPFLGPNQLGLALAMGLSAIWCWPSYSRRARIAISIPIVCALAVSQSRTGLLGAVLGVTVIAAGNRRLRSIMALAVIALVASSAIWIGTDAPLPDRLTDRSAQGHVASLSESVATVIENPLGLGLGRVGPRAALFEDDPVRSESYILLISLESGLLAGLAFISIHLLLARTYISALRRRNDACTVRAARLGLGLIAAAIPSMIALPVLQEISVNGIYWALLGLAAAYSVEANEREPSIQTRTAVVTS